MRTLVLDPGLSSGLAFLDGKRLVDTQLIKGRGETWEEKTQNVADSIFNFAWVFRPDRVYIEFPVAHFRGNLKSIIKLSFLIGRIVAVLEGKIILIPVSTYRGNLPKELMWNRAMKYFKIRHLTGDVGDAVVLSMWLIKNAYI